MDVTYHFSRDQRMAELQCTRGILAPTIWLWGLVSRATLTLLVMTKVNQQNGVDHIGEYYRLGYLEFRPNARFYLQVWSKTFGFRYKL